MDPPATAAVTPQSRSNASENLSMADAKQQFVRILEPHSRVKIRPARFRSTSHTDSESASAGDLNVPAPAIRILRNIAEQMIAAGCSGDCVQVYASVRMPAVECRFVEKLGQLGQLSSKNIQRLEWRDQQEKIRRWMPAATICIRGIPTYERELTDQIFTDIHIADDCFIKTVKNPAIKLFDFAEAIASGRRSHKKLFRILDLYQSLSDFLPVIDDIFKSKPGKPVRERAVKTLAGLSEAARGMLSEFEKAVFEEVTQVPIPEGSAIHRSTKYVMNYVNDMVKYEEILGLLIVIPSYIRSSSLDLDTEFEANTGNSPLALHLKWIIVALKLNLQGKSKQYRDASLAHSFTANNVDYIIEQIKTG